MSRAIDWYIYESNREGGGGVWGGPEFIGPPLQKFTGSLRRVRKHNIWTARDKSIENYIFGILMSRAIDWYYMSQIGGGGSRVFWTPPPKIYRVTPTKI